MKDLKKPEATRLQEQDCILRMCVVCRRGKSYICEAIRKSVLKELLK